MKTTFQVIRASYGKVTNHISTYIDGGFSSEQEAEQYLCSIYHSLLRDLSTSIISCVYNSSEGSFTIETKYCLHQADILCISV